jgi:hypothetical protein
MSSIEVTALRIAWGKIINAGQNLHSNRITWRDRRIKQETIAAQKKRCGIYGENPLRAPIRRVINNFHFNRLINLMNKALSFMAAHTQRNKIHLTDNHR